ncbi:hypothetical protein QU24_04380 [Pantoea rodasii]|uniref:FAD dependent oxidoreductase domain-containing protein n=1 Tax=Pantoea rodasii TaxID=1076549 RepID=A0A0B1R8D5_9GAMM|nr:FAD-dependent oxidoreductase [Pantoea rodasii]KHJ69283.1 hypothetical protein QU24_04380 [Pantoea rodasii]
MCHKIAVVGAGITGMMTALNCARKGAEVDIYDQYDIPNKHSNSWAYARLWRAIHEDNPALEALAIRSGVFWENLMNQYGENMIRPAKIIRINKERTLGSVRFSYEKNKKVNYTTSLKHTNLTSFFNIKEDNNVLTGEDGLLLGAHVINEHLHNQLKKHEKIRLLPNETLFAAKGEMNVICEKIARMYKKTLICTSSPIGCFPNDVKKNYQYHLDIELMNGQSFSDAILDMGDIHKTWCIPSIDGKVLKLSASHFSFSEPPDENLRENCKKYLLNKMKIPCNSIKEHVSQYYSSAACAMRDGQLWRSNDNILIMDACNARNYKISPALAEDISQFAFE